MDELSTESRALYELLKADTDEIYERKFMDYKKEILDTVRVFIKETKAQFTAIDDSLESIQSRMGVDLEGVKESLGGDIMAVQTALSLEIAKLAATVDRAIRSDTNAAAGGASAY